MKKYPLLFIILGFHIFQSNAQSLSELRNYTVSDGLPSNTVYDVIEDSIGYIWIATDNGLTRFDGYQFQSYDVNDGLGDNEVLYFKKDSSNRIWMAPLNGRVSYLQDGNITLLESIDWIGHVPLESRVLNIIELRKDVFVFVDVEGNLFIVDFNLENVLYKRFNVKCSYFVKTDNNRLFAFGQFKKYYEIFYDDASLIIHDGVTAQITRLGRLVSLDGSSFYNFYLGLKAGTHWFDVDEVSYFDLQSSKLPDATLYNAKKKASHVLLFTSDGTYSFKNNEFKKLSEEVIINEYLDQQGNTWYSTLSNGLYMKPPVFIRSTTAPEEFIEIKRLDNEGVLFGNRSAQVFKWSFNQLLLQESLNPPVIPDYKKSDIKIKDIYQSDTYGILVLRSDMIYNKNNFFDIRFSNKGIVSIEGRDCVYGRFGVHPIDELIQNRNYHSKEIKWPFDNITKMAHHNGELFMGTENGIFKIVDADTTDMTVTYPELKIRVNDLIADSTGIWVASDGKGLMHIDNDSIVSYSIGTGLFSNDISSIYRDGYNMWVGTASGLHKIDIQTQKVSHISENEGLTSKIVYGVVEMNDTIFCLTDKGLNYFDKNINLNRSESQTFFWDKVSVDNNDITIKPSTKEIIAGPDSRRVTFNYVCLDYLSAGKIEYEYQILSKGQPINESEWFKTKQTSVSLWNIEPGKYSFYVRNKPYNGNWSEPLVLDFEVKPVYWKTFWFQLVMILLVLGLAFLLFRRRQIRKERRIALNNQIISSELKALRSQINPHFMFNALNSIQRFILKSDHTIADSYLAKFSKLMRYTLEHSDVMLVTINEEIETLKLYIDMELLRVNTPFTYEFEIENELDKYTTKIPAMVIQPFIENAIWHGLPGKEDGKLSISFTERDGQLLIAVEDNGKGFSKGDMTEGHTSMGVKLVKDRLEMLSTYFQSSMKLTVLCKDEGVKGTKVEILVPIDLY